MTAEELTPLNSMRAEVAVTCSSVVHGDDSTAYCWSSSDDGVDLLSRTRCSMVRVASDQWVSIQSIAGIDRGRHCLMKSEDLQYVVETSRSA